MTVKPYRPVVLSILADKRAKQILDAPCGDGWLGRALRASDSHDINLDGAGLWEFPAPACGYRHIVEHDLDTPLQGLQDKYDAIVCGEAIHLITNPGAMVGSFMNHLRPGGVLIITTPNTWSVTSRLQFLFKGFYAGFSPMIGKRRGDYITFIPWTFSQLHLLLTQSGYIDITLHAVQEPKGRRFGESLLALPSKLYYRRRRRLASTDEERGYWTQAATAQSLHGTWLVVSARAPCKAGA